MWTEATLLDAVVAHFGRYQPVHLLRQVEMEDRRIDAVLVIGNRRVGIEAKVSRTDFRRESDSKRAPTWRACNETVYLCPPGLIEPSETPDGWGLWYAVGPDSVRVMRGGLRHGAHPHAADLLATSLAIRAAATERRVRAAERAEDPAAALVAVDAEVQRLEALLAQQQDAVRRERRRAQDAAEQVAAYVGAQVCSMCWNPIQYTRVGAWRHIDRSHDEDCDQRRAEAERLYRMSLTGAEYIVTTPPRIVPAHISIDR